MVVDFAAVQTRMRFGRLEFGDRVRERRQALGWTKSRLADEAGIDVSQVSRIERGVTTAPSPDKITRLARALGVSTDWLLTGVCPSVLAPVLEEWMLPPDMRFLWPELQKASRHNQQQFRESLAEHGLLITERPPDQDNQDEPRDSRLAG